MPEKTTIKQLMLNLPQQGRVEWLSVREGKRKKINPLNKVVVLSNGLQGDHYLGRSGKRSVTLIQQEHLAVIASLLHREQLDPAVLRRNIMVSGINLLALKGREFKIGTAILEMTGLCHPCSRMEEVLGEGGYNAMRGHGGITARIVLPGMIKCQDKVEAL